MRLVILSNFFFPIVVKLLFADAKYAFNRSVERGALGLSEFVPDFWNGIVAVMFGDVKHE